MQIRNNFKNIIFIACKWGKICKYYLNSMVILYSIGQKEEKECMWVKYLIYTALSQFQICCNLRVFSSSAKSVFPKFQSSQKMFFFQVRDRFDQCCTIQVLSGGQDKGLLVRTAATSALVWDWQVIRGRFPEASQTSLVEISTISHTCLVVAFKKNISNIRHEDFRPSVLLLRCNAQTLPPLNFLNRVDWRALVENNWQNYYNNLFFSPKI